TRLARYRTLLSEDRRNRESRGKGRVNCEDGAPAEMLLEAGTQTRRCEVIVDDVSERGHAQRIETHMRDALAVFALARPLIDARPQHRHCMMDRIAGRGMPPSGAFR